MWAPHFSSVSSLRCAWPERNQKVKAYERPWHMERDQSSPVPSISIHTNSKKTSSGIYDHASVFNYCPCSEPQNGSLEKLTQSVSATSVKQEPHGCKQPTTRLNKNFMLSTLLQAVGVGDVDDQSVEPRLPKNKYVDPWPSPTRGNDGFAQRRDLGLGACHPSPVFLPVGVAQN